MVKTIFVQLPLHAQDRGSTVLLNGKDITEMLKTNTRELYGVAFEDEETGVQFAEEVEVEVEYNVEPADQQVGAREQFELLHVLLNTHDILHILTYDQQTQVRNKVWHD